MQAIGGDFHADCLPAGADVVTLIRVIHDHDDDAALALLRRARLALPQGGTLLLAEPMADTPARGPGRRATSPSICWRWASGRPPHAGGTPLVTAMLQAAGFAKARLVPTSTPLLTQLLSAS